MKLILAAVSAVVLLNAAPAFAQTELDHRVQRAWDNVFNPPPPGDPRTNWERHRDEERAQRAAYDRQRAQHAEWCRYHPDVRGCS